MAGCLELPNGTNNHTQRSQWHWIATGQIVSTAGIFLDYTPESLRGWWWLRLSQLWCFWACVWLIFVSQPRDTKTTSWTDRLVNTFQMSQDNDDTPQQDQGNTTSSGGGGGGVKTATEMVTQLQGFLELQEKDLKEREMALEKKRRQLERQLELQEEKLNEREMALEKKRHLLEQQYSNGGKDSDVLYLNVGGATIIAVLRRTLTHFEDSMLASRFSGRWDDSLEKDQDGRFFIDQDPNVFVPLVNYLRQQDHKTREDLVVPPPCPTADFCSMLEYYGLMSSVYPQEWHRVWGTRKGVVMTKESTTGGPTITISNSRGCKKFMLQVQGDCPTKPVNANSFTAVFEQGSQGRIGWISCAKYDENKGDESEDDEIVVHDGIDDRSEDYDSEGDQPNDYEENSFYFDLVDATFKVDEDKRKNVPNTWSGEFPVTIICTRDAAANTYSIQVLENDSDTMIIDTYCISNQLFPYVYFSGKVTVSNVLYAF